MYKGNLVQSLTESADRALAARPMTLRVPTGKLRCPWMGVPIPGERPIVLMTEQVRGALAGVTVTDTAVCPVNPVTGETSLEWGSNEWRRKSGIIRGVEVTYRHGRRGRGRVVFYDRGDGMLRLNVHDWAEKHRKRLSAPVPVKLSGREAEIARQIKRLEKEKSKLYLSDQPPVHPFLHHREAQWIVGQMPDQTASVYLRESEWRWHDEKPKRKELARIAGMWLRNKLTSKSAYRVLREAGWEVTPVSKLRTHDRERRPYQDDYWKHLHEFVRGMAANVARKGRDAWSKRTLPREGDEFTRHADARLEYLATRREGQTIDNQIAALRELAAPPLELTEPPATEWDKVKEMLCR